MIKTIKNYLKSTALGSLYCTSWYRLHRLGYRLWPKLFNDPDIQSKTNDFDKQDIEENRQSTPPEGESIELNALWVVEVYPPSYANGLMSALKSLGWDKEDLPLSRRNVTQWLQSIRKCSSSGSWLNIGPIVRPDDRRFHHPKRMAFLPNGVDYAFATMHSVTSSITCVVIGFFFTENIARKYEEILRQPRSTFVQNMVVKKGYRSYQFNTPILQKRDSIRKMRKDLRELCANWFRNNLPGLFASGITEGQFPTFEFIGLHENTPFPTLQPKQQPPEYLTLLGIDNDINAWVSDDLPGFRLGMPSFFDHNEEFHLILAAKHSDIDADLKAYGGRNRQGYVNYLSHQVDVLMTRWAVRSMLEGYLRIMNGIRDTIPHDAKSTSETLKFLNFLRKTIKDSTDLVTMCSDLVDYSQSQKRFEHNVVSFKKANEKYGIGASTLSEFLRLMISERSAWLRRTDDSVRNLLSQYGTVQSTLVNLQLQLHVKRLTWLIVGLSLITLAIGIWGLLSGK